MSLTLLRLALPIPLRQSFDYLPPAQTDVASLVPGVRVRVPFGRGHTVGVLLAVTHETPVAHAKLKYAAQILDTTPVLDARQLALATWLSEYYHHPLGEVLAVLLPVALRQGAPALEASPEHYRLTAIGCALTPTQFKRAPQQAKVWQALRTAPAGLTRSALQVACGMTTTALANALKTLLHREWIETFVVALAPPALPTPLALPGPTLNAEQHAALEAISAALGRFQSFLLDGVTGSGKTEVYLRFIERLIHYGKQVLVLVPEIGLTPQLIERFTRRFPTTTLVTLHSRLSDRERLQGWLAARAGAPIVLGTRSALFAPLPRLGAIIVDEEHDASFKQLEGLRYSARDAAVWYAQHVGVPIVLGSATPALETLHNVMQGRYQRLPLTQRAGAAQPPTWRFIDVRRLKLDQGLSAPLLQLMREHLEHGNQVLLFINRRGYAPLLLCHDCGWIAECRRCDARMTLHRKRGVDHLYCHHCAAERPAERHCPSCAGSELRALGQGTERIEETLQARFKKTPILRIDADTTRRKGSLDELLQTVRQGTPCILVGTQMLAKGHHFPDVTLVGIINADGGFYSVDFRGPERMAQQIVQVAGRAGRADKPGTMVIQTHHPDNTLLQTLLTQDYHACAQTLLQERRVTHLPPFIYLALLRAEATQRDAVMDFLHAACEVAGTPRDVQVRGPIAASMERKAGRYRAQLLLSAARRSALHTFLAQWMMQISQLPAARRARWMLDVDPLEMV